MKPFDQDAPTTIAELLACLHDQMAACLHFYAVLDDWCYLLRASVIRQNIRMLSTLPLAQEF